MTRPILRHKRSPLPPNSTRLDGSSKSPIRTTLNPATGRGHIARYAYTNRNFPHYITGITDARGSTVAQNLYDTEDRLLGMIDADGRTNHFHHNLASRTETITNRLGDRTIHVYETNGNVVQSVDALGFNTYRGFDTNNNRIWEANHLNQTNRFAYNDKDELIGTTNALGHANAFTYDPRGNLLTSIDALGRGTTNQYDAANNLTNSVDALGNGTAYLYSDRGLLVSQKDAR